MSIIRSLSLFRRLSAHHRTSSHILLTSLSSSMSSFQSKTKLDESMRKLVDSKQYKQALDLFEQEQKSQQYTDISINMALKACTLLKDYERGVQIEKQLSGKTQQRLGIQTSLLQLYMHCGDMKNAERIYSTSNEKSNQFYTVLFKGFILNNVPEKVLVFVDQIKITPDEYNLTTIFSACGKVNNDRGKEIGLKLFDNMPEHLHTNPFIATTALDMLMSFGEMNRAEKIFESMKEKNIYSYGAMLKGYIENNMNEKALDLFEQISVSPDDVIHTLVFKACGQLNNERARTTGKQLLDHILKKQSTKINLWNSAIHMLMRFGDVGRAERLFKSLKRKDGVSYNVMIKGYVENEMNNKALDFFEQMPIEPSDMTFTLILKACAQLNNEHAQTIGRKLLDQLSKKPQIENTVLNKAIHMLMCFGNASGAEQLFESLKEKDVVSYGAMMKGYIDNDMSNRALDLFATMSVNLDDTIYTLAFKACAEMNNERAKLVGMKLLDEIKRREITNPVTLTSAINMLISFGEIDHAEQLFESLKEKDALSFGVMMKGYIIHNQPLRFKQTFQQMKQQHTSLHADMFIVLLRTCARLGLPSFGQSVIAEIPHDLINDIQVVNAMISMLGKVGAVEDAWKVFTSTHKPDVFTYITMINAYGLNGRGMEAVKLYHQMPIDLPNEICHTCVLNACSHSGLVAQARSIFNNINNKSGIVYTSMIDCLSRLQMFDEAEELIQEYEHYSNKPNARMYMALLSGARNARNSDLSLKLFKKMEQLFPGDKDLLVSSSILLGNIFTSIGDYDQASAIRRHRIEHHGAKVKPGVTWTEKDGELSSFSAHDRSHPLADEIYAEAKVIAKELIEHGHQFDASWITRPLKDTETVESVLCGHSERLALAYHFIGGRRPSKIHMVKNLRVCGDCHHATKVIAKIRQCEIVVRDANRIHHFQSNGQCSCMDHF